MRHSCPWALSVASAVLAFAAWAGSDPLPPPAARDAFEKATLAARDKKTDEAIAGFRKAVSLFPAYAQAWSQLGQLQLAQNQLDDARKSLRAAVQANPEFRPAYQTLVQVELRARNWKDLIEVTERLNQLGPDASAYLFNALAHYNLREYAAAEKSAREAERLDTDRSSSAAWEILGELLAIRGDFSAAAAQFRAYLEMEPNGPDHAVIRARLAEAEKRAAASAPPSAVPVFRTETSLVLVRFQVIPRKGELQSDLRPDDIELREDGVAQKIALFEGGRFYPHQVPLHIALLFDCSGSMQYAGLVNPHVFEQTLLQEYEFLSIGIYAFSDDLIRLTPPTRDVPQLMKAVEAVRTVPAGDTPLFGDIVRTARDLVSLGGNTTRMLVVFSDGESTRFGDGAMSTAAANVARELGITLFPVLLSAPGPIGPGANPYSQWEQDRVRSIGAYMELGPATGGKSVTAVASADALLNILKSLATRIRYDYVAGYYPASGDGKSHKVEVVLRAKNGGQLLGGQRTVVHR